MTSEISHTATHQRIVHTIVLKHTKTQYNRLIIKKKKLRNVVNIITIFFFRMISIHPTLCTKKNELLVNGKDDNGQDVNDRT